MCSYLFLKLLIIAKLSPIYDFIPFFFVLYWFVHFLKFGPPPSENPRCEPGKKRNQRNRINLENLTNIINVIQI